MNRKVIIGLIIAIIIIAGIIGFSIYRKNNTENKNNVNISNELGKSEEQDNTIISDKNEQEDGKVLVVYYSAQTHTKAVAEKIANNLKADIFEIIPKQIYTTEDLDWTNNNSRVTREHENESLRDVELKTTKVENWEDYDTILIGYPIWWGIAAWPVDTFIKANDFTEKTVIPFCTSTSSGLGQSGKLLEQEAKSGNWLEGNRFSSNASDFDIKTWTDSLK